MDDKIINALSNISNNLYVISQALSNPKNNDGSDTDTPISILEGKITDSFELIAKDINSVVETNKKILKNQEIMLKSSSNISPTNAYLTNIFSDDNKNKIKDGVSSIFLIAGGLLAIGTAFKIIGDVDVPSVLAISASLPLVAFAFEKIANIKTLTPKVVFNTSLALVGIAGSIYLSSLILSKVQPVGLAQLATSITISAMFTVVSYGLSNLLKSMDSFSLKSVLLLPLVMAGVSTSIYLSSLILSKVQPVGLPQLFTSIMVSAMFTVISYGLTNLLKSLNGAGGIGKIAASIILLPLVLTGISYAIELSSKHIAKVESIKPEQFLTALGISILFIPLAYSLQFLSKATEKIDYGKILLLPVIMTGMSLTVLASSYILAQVQNIEPGKLLNITLQGLAISVLGVTMGLAFYVLGKLDTKSILQGTISILAISTSIALSSQILALGNYTNAPPLMWVLQSGVSILAFSLLTVGLGLIATSGVGMAAIGLGAVSILAISGAIYTSSHILAQGNYTNAPSIDWSMGVSLAILPFSLAIIALGAIAVTGVGAIAIAAGALMMPIVANSIVETGKILNGGVYDKAPSLSWAAGVGLSIGAFSTGLITLAAINLATLGNGVEALKTGTTMLSVISNSIVETSKLLNNGVYTGGPTVAWSSGVALSIGAFSTVLSILTGNGIFGIFGGGVSPEQFKTSINTIADGIVSVAQKFANAKTSFAGGPDEKWALGVGGAISAFSPVYKVLSENDGGKVATNDMRNAILVISQSIIDSANLFANNTAAFDINKAPKKEWGENVSAAIQAFVPALNYISENDGIFTSGTDTLTKNISAVVSSISNASIQLSKGRYNPINKDWISMLSKTVLGYIDLSTKIDDYDPDDDKLPTMANNMFRLSKSYDSLSGAINKVNNSLKAIEPERMNIFKNMTGSIVMLSLLDEDQLENVIDKLDEKAEMLSESLKSVNSGDDGSSSLTTISPKQKSNPNDSLIAELRNLYGVMTSVNSNLEKIAKSNSSILNEVSDEGKKKRK